MVLCQAFFEVPKSGLFPGSIVGPFFRVQSRAFFQGPKSGLFLRLLLHAPILKSCTKLLSNNTVEKLDRLLNTDKSKIMDISC